MKLGLIIGLQLLSIAFSATQSSESTPFPQQFDLREIFPSCFTVYEEGICAGNWAIAVADTMSNMLCTENNTNIVISPQHIIDCVDRTDLSCKNATSAQTIEDALSFGNRNGYTTSSCYPYISEFTGAPSDSCPNQCTDGSFISALYKVGQYNSLSSQDDIMNFIIANGPVIAVIDLYSDLLLYNSGIYVPDLTSQSLGYHAVKIVGWTSDPQGNPAWIAANSWSLNWGMQGYFNIYPNSSVIVQVYAIPEVISA